MMKRVFYHFGPCVALLPLPPPLTHPKNIFWKNKKTPRDIIMLHLCTINDSHKMYGSWDLECNGHNFLSFRTVFCPFTPPNNQKNQNFDKNEKSTWRYYHFTHVYHKWQSHDVQFLRYEHDREFFVILDLFLPFYAPNNLKNQYSEKMKKMAGDITILNMCTINDNHMMYGSWYIECNRRNFLLFWTIFCHLTPLKTHIIKILKKWQKVPGDIIILHKCTINDNHMTYCHFGLFFALLPPSPP